jgi:(2R)-3-sulfolactate dehydrogenase (NADP+)
VARASDHGVGVVAVGNSGHCGVLGIYTLPGLAAGMVSLVFSNGPAVMPPWGGREPLLSTSPLAAGIPSQPEPAIVDLATSAVARGKIAERASQGKPLDQGWAFDSAGAPTTDPAAALNGMLAPSGGAKGYALAFLVEALTGGLVGPSLAPEVRDMYRHEQVAEPQRIAHLVVTLDPRQLDTAPTTGHANRLDALAESVRRAGGRLPGAGKVRLADLSPSATIRLGRALDTTLRAWAAAHAGRWTGTQVQQ